MAQDDEIIEVKPFDPKAPSGSDSVYVTDHSIPDEPPEFSVFQIINMIRERGFSESIKDEAWGPHVHLMIILCTVFLIAIIIGVITLATA
jgi:hypothetical protein